MLGPLTVEIDGREVSLAGRQRALLTLLAMHANEVVSVSRIADALWGEQLPDDPSNSVQTVVSRLRRALGRGAPITTQPHGYMLECDHDAIDAHRFEALDRRARAVAETDPAAGAGLLDEALGLWHGRAYDDFADEFARPAATHLEELRVAARELRARVALALGALDDAVARATALAAEHPLRDGPVDLTMRALHAAGRTPDALSAYRAHRDLLDDQLGLSPSAALRELEGQILRDDAAVRPPHAREADGVPGSVAPPRSARLPWRPSPLIGRDAEVAAVRSLLDRARVVTVVGPGGVGKTRLALEVAHLVAETGGQVVWIDLVSVAPERVVHAVASSVGIEIARDDDPSAVVCAVLATRRALLLLDNAEHVLDEIAALVERLAATASGIRMVVTSRERLAIDPEVVHTVGPLPTDGDADSPAVRLYLDRWWQEAQPAPAEVTDVVAHICRALDGLPLAIELAAARTAALGVHAIADRMASRLDLLTGGRRTAAERHRTLRAVVEWSHRMLDPDETALFARLAVFPGSFSLAQVEAVCAGDGLATATIAPVLSRLVDQSLVQVGPDRFWLLETLRAYAMEQLPADGSRRLAARHARHTADRLRDAAERLSTRDEAAAAADLQALTPDLHATWRHAFDHDDALAVRVATDISRYAYTRQRLDMLQWSLRLVERTRDDQLTPALLAAAAQAAWSTSDFERGIELAERGIELAGGYGAAAAAAPLDVSGDLAMFDLRVDDAIARYRAIIRLPDVDELTALVAEVCIAQAHAYGPGWRNGYDQIGGLAERVAAVGNPTLIAFFSFVAGELTLRVDRDRAVEHFGRAVHAGAAVDSRLFTMLGRSAATAERVTDGPSATMIREVATLIDAWEELDNNVGHWWALGIAASLLARSDAAEAKDAAVVAGAVRANIHRAWRFPRHIEHLQRSLGAVRERLGVEAADAGLERGATLSRSAATTVTRDALAAMLA